MHLDISIKPREHTQYYTSWDCAVYYDDHGILRLDMTPVQHFRSWRGKDYRVLHNESKSHVIGRPIDALFFLSKYFDEFTEVSVLKGDGYHAVTQGELEMLLDDSPIPISK